MCKVNSFVLKRPYSSLGNLQFRKVRFRFSWVFKAVQDIRQMVWSRLERAEGVEGRGSAHTLPCVGIQHVCRGNPSQHLHKYWECPRGRT